MVWTKVCDKMCDGDTIHCCLDSYSHTKFWINNFWMCELLSLPDFWMSLLEGDSLSQRWAMCSNQNALMVRLMVWQITQTSATVYSTWLLRLELCGTLFFIFEKTSGKSTYEQKLTYWLSVLAEYFLGSNIGRLSYIYSITLPYSPAKFSRHN